jgi:hypothetical protein
MKVYLLFWGHNYYPCGFVDYQGTFPDYDSAFNFMVEKYKSLSKEYYSSKCYDNWTEIVEVTETESNLVFRVNDISSFVEGFNNETR